MRIILPVLSGLILITPSAFGADLITNIPMETMGDAKIKNTELTVKGLHRNENKPGAFGVALRFDGYSTYIDGEITPYIPSGPSSFSIWIAPETYPIVEHDVATSEKITLAGTLDHNIKQGWAFSLGKTGNYSFDCYIAGWYASVEASDLLPCYEWSLLVAVNDPENGKLTLYRNGDKVGEVRSAAPMDNDITTISIGKTKGANNGIYQLKTFNGLIDDINIFDGVVSETELNKTPENPADLSIPEERFANDLQRPKFHGMPGANWTNECHGMAYSDGKYHLFFQKNANGPYMSRLHWGHISSSNLYEWTEEKIAIAPGESYDIKGCWSGCLFTDDLITDGKPNILYTGVDYAKAYIVQAAPADESLIDWEKKGKVIDGRPNGLSDDFRDPYFFRNGNDAYIIVGTAKDGIGATTLHKFSPLTKRWSNDGKIFFQGKSTGRDGTFWEMPNITPMGDDKWLFTVTPQNTSTGVQTMYWIGEINSDGTFLPDFDNPLNIEMISGLGYGLLSPTIFQKDDKTILMGIVPDKLPTQDNCRLGWAHLYSFPREISLDEDGSLLQKPNSGLEHLRDDNGFSATSFTIDGVKEIESVSGRQLEVKCEFVLGQNPFGISLFKNGNGKASITYNPVLNRLSVDFSSLNRLQNDQQNGIYSCQLKEKPESGSKFTLDVWVDGSILDIFVNNRYATSVRVFPTDTDADGIEVFSIGGSVEVANLQAWNLVTDKSLGGGNGDDAGVNEIFQDLPEFVNVYSVNGFLVKRNVKAENATDGLTPGIYVIGSHKMLVK